MNDEKCTNPLFFPLYHIVFQLSFCLIIKLVLYLLALEKLHFGFFFIVTVLCFFFRSVIIFLSLLLQVNFDYSYGYQEHGERTDQPFQTELNTSMMYYYDDGTGVQVYPVEEALLKEYIKRQM